VVSDALSLQEAFLLGDVSSRASGWRVNLVRGVEHQTREEFAPRIGMKPSNLHSVESGKSYIRPKYAKALFQEFHVDFNFVYYGDPQHLPVRLAVQLLHQTEELPPPQNGEPGEDRA
jgi:hypothetical protein